MYIAYRWRDRTLGRGELIVAIILISLLIAIFINKSLELFALTEERLVMSSVANMNTSLQFYSVLKLAGLIESEFSATMNPVELMQSAASSGNISNTSPYIGIAAQFEQYVPLANYLGELIDPDIEQLEKGNWYFDRQNNLLCYLPKYGMDNGSIQKYKVFINFEDMNTNNSYDINVDRFQSIYINKVN
jgi:hypothetical protein